MADQRAVEERPVDQVKRTLQVDGSRWRAMKWLRKAFASLVFAFCRRDHRFQVASCAIHKGHATAAAARPVDIRRLLEIRIGRSMVMLANEYPDFGQFYGDRSGMIADLSGHLWSVAKRIGMVDPADMQRRFTQALAGSASYA
ncbi:MAG TPA: hypothetical protein VHL31_08475 [Geminicoccus sp.]|uniref:hypothetical protein n=1 Tax=Geminicoccus sp. TaxID=2024832 RepID=UPI002E32A9DD|nr:hypothetical protein [Geminicoccus sp.]HEX2526325.1 hypothetical protein [Geminicoccus sp.]